MDRKSSIKTDTIKHRSNTDWVDINTDPNFYYHKYDRIKCNPYFFNKRNSCSVQSLNQPTNMLSKFNAIEKQSAKLPVGYYISKHNYMQKSLMNPVNEETTKFDDGDSEEIFQNKQNSFKKSRFLNYNDPQHRASSAGLSKIASVNTSTTGSYLKQSLGSSAFGTNKKQLKLSISKEHTDILEPEVVKDFNDKRGGIKEQLEKKKIMNFKDFNKIYRKQVSTGSKILHRKKTLNNNTLKIPDSPVINNIYNFTSQNDGNLLKESLVKNFMTSLDPNSTGHYAETIDALMKSGTNSTLQKPETRLFKRDINNSLQIDENVYDKTHLNKLSNATALSYSQSNLTQQSNLRTNQSIAKDFNELNNESINPNIHSNFRLRGQPQSQKDIHSSLPCFEGAENGSRVVSFTNESLFYKKRRSVDKLFSETKKSRSILKIPEPSAIKLAREKHFTHVLKELTKDLKDTKELYNEKKWKEMLTADLQKAIDIGFKNEENGCSEYHKSFIKNNTITKDLEMQDEDITEIFKKSIINLLKSKANLAQEVKTKTHIVKGIPPEKMDQDRMIDLKEMENIYNELEKKEEMDMRNEDNIKNATCIGQNKEKNDFSLNKECNHNIYNEMLRRKNPMTLTKQELAMNKEERRLKYYNLNMKIRNGCHDLDDKCQQFSKIVTDSLYASCIEPQEDFSPSKLKQTKALNVETGYTLNVFETNIDEKSESKNQNNLNKSESVININQKILNLKSEHQENQNKKMANNYFMGRSKDANIFSIKSANTSALHGDFILKEKSAEENKLSSVLPTKKINFLNQLEKTRNEREAEKAKKKQYGLIRMITKDDLLKDDPNKYCTCDLNSFFENARNDFKHVTDPKNNDKKNFTNYTNVNTPQLSPTTKSKNFSSIKKSGAVSRFGSPQHRSPSQRKPAGSPVNKRSSGKKCPKCSKIYKKVKPVDQFMNLGAAFMQKIDLAQKDPFHHLKAYDELLENMNGDLNCLANDKKYYTQELQPNEVTPKQQEFINAIKEGDLEKIDEMLIQDSSLVNVCDKARSSALHWGVKKDNVKVLDILLENGADIYARDDLGRTPIDLAKRIGFPKVQTRLHKVFDKFGHPNFKKIENTDFEYVIDEYGISVFKAVKRLVDEIN